MEGRANRAEQSGATRGTLLTVARELFAERGYAGVGTEEIVQRAKVTRGALYHHFRDKRDLFRAVHEQAEEELAQRIGEQIVAAGTTDALEALRTGARTFLDACTDRSVARITLVDAPSVLGWQEWREIDERHGLGLVTAGLQGAMDAGAIAEAAREGAGPPDARRDGRGRNADRQRRGSPGHPRGGGAGDAGAARRPPRLGS